MSRFVSKVSYVLVGLFVSLVVLSCLGMTWPVELLFWTLFGWISYLSRVGPQIRPDWSAVGMGLGALALFAMGLHWFLAWFYAAAMAAKTSSSEAASFGQSKGAGWLVRWTLSIVAIVVMMFVAGISMVGITHQVAWLANSKTPMVASSFGALRRMQSGNNLKQIGIALQLYHDAHSSFPPGAIASSDGRVMHSWQTALLPYVEQANLYRAIDLNQPWDTEGQKKPFATRLRIYQIPFSTLPEHDQEGYALSHYAANQHVIGGTSSRTVHDFADGVANTILCGEAAGNCKAWGNPSNWRDPALGINVSPDGFGSPWPGGAQFVFGDGHVQFLSDKIDPQVLRALATPAGGEKVNSDTDY